MRLHSILILALVFLAAPPLTAQLGEILSLEVTGGLNTFTIRGFSSSLDDDRRSAEVGYQIGLTGRLASRSNGQFTIPLTVEYVSNRGRITDVRITDDFFGDLGEASPPDAPVSYRGDLDIRQRRIRVSLLPTRQILGRFLLGAGASASANLHESHVYDYDVTIRAVRSPLTGNFVPLREPIVEPRREDFRDFSGGNYFSGLLLAGYRLSDRLTTQFVLELPVRGLDPLVFPLSPNLQYRYGGAHYSLNLAYRLLPRGERSATRAAPGPR